MCGPGFVARAADSTDLAGIGAVAAETGVSLPDAERYLELTRAGKGQLDVAMAAGDVVGFCATGQPGEGGVAVLVGPAVAAAGGGLGIEKALLRRAAEGAAGRGVRVLCARVPAGDPVRAQTLVGQGFQRTGQADAGGAFMFTKTL